MELVPMAPAPALLVGRAQNVISDWTHASTSIVVSTGDATWKRAAVIANLTFLTTCGRAKSVTFLNATAVTPTGRVDAPRGSVTAVWDGKARTARRSLSALLESDTQTLTGANF
jgi:hypothetical protein